MNMDSISDPTIHSVYVHLFCVKEMYNISSDSELDAVVVHNEYWRMIEKLYYSHINSKPIQFQSSSHQFKNIC